jgi:hypothetical protein
MEYENLNCWRKKLWRNKSRSTRKPVRVFSTIVHHILVSNRVFTTTSGQPLALDHPEDPSSYVKYDGDDEEDPENDFDSDGNGILTIGILLPFVES